MKMMDMVRIKRIDYPIAGCVGSEHVSSFFCPVRVSNSSSITSFVSYTDSRVPILNESESMSLKSIFESEK